MRFLIRFVKRRFSSKNLVITELFLNFIFEYKIKKITMELAITVTAVVIVLSVLVGYSLFKGGVEIENNNIKMAGIYWLLITTISIIMLLITYSNTMKLSGAEEDAYTEEGVYDDAQEHSSHNSHGH